MAVRRARTLRGLGAVVAASALVAGCSAAHGGGAAAPSAPSASTVGDSAAAPGVLRPLAVATPAVLTPYYEQRLSWRACRDGFQCATMKVPLDYGRPAGSELRISVIRKPASGHRRGSLVINPGGPGGSGVQYARYAAQSFPAVVRSAYDIVGFDPRGVGASAPVRCLTGPQMDAFTAVDTTPDDPAEIRRLVTADRRFAVGCERHSGRLIAHLSTVEVARDMDVLRAVLGDRRLTYVGKSYGTFLGATYAGLFPSRVGRMVLDGAMDPSLSAMQADLTQAGGFETAWHSFAADCVTRRDCPLGHTRAGAGRRLDAFLRSVDAHPLPTGGPRRLTEAQALTGVIQAMYAKFLWPQLRRAMDAALHGRGGPLLALSDSYYERDTKGHYSNLMYANMAVNCLDLPPAARGPRDIERVLPQFRRESPHFGAAMAWMSLGCAYWPVRATGAPRTVPAHGAAPIVVIGTLRDPATPYAWARSLARQLQSGRLLTYRGDGHTVYGGQNDCIDTAVDLYLLEGKVPARGKTCRAV